MTITTLAGKISTTFPARINSVPPLRLTKNGDTYTFAIDTAYLENLVPPTTFIGLTDVPASYAGQRGKQLAVNNTETGLEFAAPLLPWRWTQGTFPSSNTLNVTFKRSLTVTTSGSALVTATVGNFFPSDVNKPLQIVTGSSVATTGNLRFAATRCSIPNSAVNNKSQIMTRSGHRAWVALSQIKVGFPAVRISPASNDLTEFAFPGTATITASVEYPAGVFTQIKFSGVAAGSCPSGQILFSDLLTLGFTIPAGALFWIRTFFVNGNGVYFTDPSNGGQANAEYGDESSSGTGGLTDKTMAGTITNDSGFCYRPACILASTNLLSVGLIGDSLTEGVGETEGRPFLGDVGLLAKTLATVCPMVNLGLGGTTLQNPPPAGSHEYWGKTGTARAQLLAYCTDFIIHLGTNDLAAFVGNRTAAQVATDLQTFITTTLPALGAPAGAHKYLATIGPLTTSTDGWVTAANQTVGANEAQRVIYNNSIRGSIANVDGTFDVADVLETSRNSGLWNPSFTSDGLHGNVTGYSAVASSGVISLGVGWSGIITGYVSPTAVNVASSSTPTYPAAAAGVTAVVGADEPDANYVVAGLAGNFNETFWVTAPTAAGFTLHSSNATSTATVTALVVR